MATTLAERLIDDFDDNTLNTTLWTKVEGGSATVAETGGQIVVTFPASSTASTDGELQSVSTFDLTGSSVYIRVTNVPASATNADALFRIYTDANNYFQWIYEAGTLYAQRKNASVAGTIATIVYSSATHIWWKISESGGVVTWWTSIDGASWTSQGTYTHGMTITAMKFLGAGLCYQNETNPGTFTFDDVNCQRRLGPHLYLDQGFQ